MEIVSFVLEFLLSDTRLETRIVAVLCFLLLLSGLHIIKLHRRLSDSIKQYEKLSSKYDELNSRHVALSARYDKYAYEIDRHREIARVVITILSLACINTKTAKLKEIYTFITELYSKLREESLR